MQGSDRVEPHRQVTFWALAFGAGGIVSHFGTAAHVAFAMAGIFLAGLLYSAGVHRGETA